MYPSALRNGVFARLFYAFVLTDTASTVMFVVLPLVAYERSGSGQAFAFVLLGGSVGRLAAVPVGGVLADRFDRRRIMLVGDSVLLAILAVVVASVLREWWFLLAAAQFAQNVTGALTGRAAPALRRDIVADEHRVQSNALMQLASSTGVLVGPMLGAALYAAAGFGVVALLEGAALTGSLLLVFGLRHEATKVVRDDLVGRGPTSGVLVSAVRETGRDLSVAARATCLDPYLRWTIVAAPLSGMANGLFLVALVPWLGESIGARPAIIGPLFAVLGGAAVVGGLAIARAGERVDMARLLAAACAIFGLAPLLLLGTPPLPLVFVVIGLIGLAESAWWVSETTIQQRRIPSNLQGRVPALWSTANRIGNVLALGAAGFTIDRFDPMWTMSAAVASFALAMPVGLLAARAASAPLVLIGDSASTTADADLAVSG